VDLVGRMKGVEPEVLVDWNVAILIKRIPSRSSTKHQLALIPSFFSLTENLLFVAGAVLGDVSESVLGRRIQHLIKYRLGVKDLGPGIAVLLAELLHISVQLSIEAGECQPLVLDTPLSLSQDQWRALHRWHRQEDKVPSSLAVERVDESEVLIEELLMEVIEITEPVRVSDIVDADPDEEQALVSLPFQVCWGNWLREVWDEEVVDLILEGEDVVSPRLNELGVDGGATVGKVPDGLAGLVIACGKVADPVRAISGSPAGVRRVAEGVGFGWKRGTVG
jgi:hypothetical protein